MRPLSTLCYYDSNCQSIIFDTFKAMPAVLTQPSPNKIPIFVRLDNGNGCELTVSPEQTLEQLTSRLGRCDLTLPASFRFLHLGRSISDHSISLKELGVTAKGILHVASLRPVQMRLVRFDVCIFFQGDKTFLSCQNNHTVFDLKHQLHRTLGIQPKLQTLVFRSTRLENSHTLEHYQIKPYSLLCLTQSSGKAPQLNMSSNKGATFIKASLRQLPDANRSLSKEMFRTQIWEGRQAYEIEVHKQESEESEMSFTGRNFNFQQMSPKISELLQTSPREDAQFSCGDGSVQNLDGILTTK